MTKIARIKNKRYGSGYYSEPNKKASVRNMFSAMTDKQLKAYIDYTDDMTGYSIAVEELRSRQ